MAKANTKLCFSEYFAGFPLKKHLWLGREELTTIEPPTRTAGGRRKGTWERWPSEPTGNTAGFLDKCKGMENHYAHTQEHPETWASGVARKTKTRKTKDVALLQIPSQTAVAQAFWATKEVPQLPIKAYTSRVHRDSLSDDCPMDVPNLMVNSRVWWSHIHIWLSQKEISLWLKRFKKHLFSGLKIIKSLYVG